MCTRWLNIIINYLCRYSCGNATRRAESLRKIQNFKLHIYRLFSCQRDVCERGIVISGIGKSKTSYLRWNNVGTATVQSAWQTSHRGVM